MISWGELKLEVDKASMEFGVAPQDHVRRVSMFVAYPPILKDLLLVGDLDVYPAIDASAEFLQRNAVPNHAE